MNPWLLVGALMLAVSTGIAGFGIGKKLERQQWQERDLATAQKVIVRQQVLIREIPKIVTKVVTNERVIEKEVERVVTVIPKALPAGCVLPDGYGELLVGAARGIGPDAAGRIDETAGAYDCTEVLAATLKDLQAGWKNSARLAGLQEYEALKGKP